MVPREHVSTFIAAGMKCLPLREISARVAALTDDVWADFGAHDRRERLGAVCGMCLVEGKLSAKGLGLEHVERSGCRKLMDCHLDAAFALADINLFSKLAKLRDCGTAQLAKAFVRRVSRCHTEFSDLIDW